MLHGALTVYLDKDESIFINPLSCNHC